MFIFCSCMISHNTAIAYMVLKYSTDRFFFTDLQMPTFNAHEVLQGLSEYPVSVLCAPPTAYRAMVQCDLKQYKFKSLRRCVSAGEPLNAEVIEKWVQGTGMCNTSFTV